MKGDDVLYLDELISNPDDINSKVMGEMEGVLRRAMAAGGKPPFEYVGAGMTGVVLASADRAWKVARRKPYSTLEEEAEWLQSASEIPEVAPHVARLHRYHPNEGVIEREYVQGRPGGWSWETKIRDLWDSLLPHMLAEGWTMPEFKADSVIRDESDTLKIVDASMPSRVSNRLVRYIRDVIEGRRISDERLSDLAFHLRMEVQDKRGSKMNEREANEILERLYEMGASRG